MATNYEIFTGLQLTFPQALSWGQYALKNGEPWGSVWNAIKERFPDVPDEQIDGSLNKDFWYQEDAYDKYLEQNPEQSEQPAWDQDWADMQYQTHLTRDPESYKTPEQQEALRYQLFWRYGTMPKAELTPVAPEEVPKGLTPAVEGETVKDQEQASLMLDNWLRDIDVTVPDPEWWVGMNEKSAESLMKQTADSYIQRRDAEETQRQQKIKDSWKVIDAGPSGWYFPQDDVLLRFVEGDPTPNDDTTNTNTVWLYNKNNNVAMPFTTPEAFNAYFKDSGMTLQEAEEMDRINLLNPAVLLDRGSPFYNATLLDQGSGIQPDGSIPDSGALVWSYGFDVRNREAAEKLDDAAMNWTNNLLDLVAKDQNIGISQETINAVRGDETAKQKIAEAAAFGGYGYADIYRFLRAKELSRQGYTEYDDFKAFDTFKSATEWYQTEEGQKALTDEVFNIPDTVAGISGDLLGNAFMFEDPEFFESPLPFLEYGSDEWNEEVEKIDSQFYDVIMQQMSADTDRAKAIADDNWRILRDSIAKRYGIELSNNALEAWDQVKAIRAQHSQRGISNSGLEEEARDTMLHRVRRADDFLRDQKDKDLEVEERNYYLNSGSDKEIYDLIQNEPEKAQRWGLIPGDDVKEWFSIAAIKGRYEGISDEDAQKMQDTFLVYHPDGTVAYRSQMFQKEAEGLAEADLQSWIAKEAELMRQRNESRERMEEEYDKNSLIGYDSKPADISTADITTGDNVPQSYAPKGEHIVDGSPENMAKYHRKLQAAGIPQSKWGDYITKQEGQGDKLFWLDPNAATNRVLGSDPNSIMDLPGQEGLATWWSNVDEMMPDGDLKNSLYEIYQLAATVPSSEALLSKITTAPTFASYDPKNTAKQFYRVGGDIFNAADKQRIGENDWNTNWTGNATETAAPATNLKTLPNVSKIASSNYDAKMPTLQPKVKNQEIQKYTASFAKQPEASDSRFWSSNPSSVSNWEKLKKGTFKL